MAAALRDSGCDVICVQEALSGQLAYLDQSLLGYERVGVGRDDGAKRGEHCAIYYNATRFHSQKTGTFWLSKTPESCTATWDPPFKRICTWILLRDTHTPKEFFIFNTHFPLMPSARSKSAKLLLQKVRDIAGQAPAFITGDFNASPESSLFSGFRNAGFRNAGLRNAEMLISPSAKLTRTHRHIALAPPCIDAIFVSSDVTILEHRVLTGQKNNIYPSDHFGVFVTVELT